MEVTTQYSQHRCAAVQQYASTMVANVKLPDDLMRSEYGRIYLTGSFGPRTQDKFNFLLEGWVIHPCLSDAKIHQIPPFNELFNRDLCLYLGTASTEDWTASVIVRTFSDSVVSDLRDLAMTPSHEKQRKITPQKGQEW
jgi:hypothetical protein